VPLSTGTCVGAYEIVALLGAGGMGEAYRARRQTGSRCRAQDPEHLLAIVSEHPDSTRLLTVVQNRTALLEKR
jgi:serine/threonine protein kinase